MDVGLGTSALTQKQGLQLQEQLRTPTGFPLYLYRSKHPNKKGMAQTCVSHQNRRKSSQKFYTKDKSCKNFVT